MLIKFVRAPLKAGGGKRLAKYLTRERDHSGKIRSHVKIVRGDPAMIGAVADSLTRKHKITHGIIAWSNEDRPTEAQKAEVVDSFLDLAYAGVDPADRAVAIVEHGEADGGVHMHVMAARTHLGTGKAMNFAKPGWQKPFGAWKEYQNLKHGWVRPEDRPRTLQGFQHGMGREPIRRALDGHLAGLVAKEAIKDRDGLVRAINGLSGATVTKITKTTISINVNGVDVRMKGPLYEQGFSPAKIAGRNEAPGTRSRRDPASQLEKAGEAYRQACERAAEYNRERYKPQADRPADLARWQFLGGSDLRERDLGPSNLDDQRLSQTAGRDRVVPDHRRLIDDRNRTGIAGRLQTAFIRLRSKIWRTRSVDRGLERQWRQQIERHDTPNLGLDRRQGPEITMR